MDEGIVQIVEGSERKEVRVLILVVVDNGLVLNLLNYIQMETSLNPCCSGRWSRTRPYKTILIINKLKNTTKQFFTFLNRKLTFS